MPDEEKPDRGIDETVAVNEIECPYCGSLINPSLKICPVCERNVTSTASEVKPAEGITDADRRAEVAIEELYALLDEVEDSEEKPEEEPQPVPQPAVPATPRPIKKVVRRPLSIESAPTPVISQPAISQTPVKKLKKCPNCNMNIAEIESVCPVCGNKEFDPMAAKYRTDGLTGGRTDGLTDGRTDGLRGRSSRDIDKFFEGKADGPSRGRTDGFTDGSSRLTDSPRGRTDGLTDGSPRHRTDGLIDWSNLKRDGTSSTKHEFTNEFVKKVRYRAQELVAQKLLGSLKEKYNLSDDDISIFTFGSQTPNSDFDLNFFLQKLPAGVTIDGVEIQIKELLNNLSKESKDIMDPTIEEMLIMNLGTDIDPEIVEFLLGYDVGKMSDFYVGSLEKALMSRVPEGMPKEEKNYWIGYRGLAPNEKLKLMAKTGMHLAGRNVLDERIKLDIEKHKVHPSEGYELYVLCTRYIAKGVLSKDSNKLAKGIVELANAISIVSGYGVLATLEDKMEMGERYLGLSLKLKHYEPLLKEAFQIRRGFDDDGKLKKGFDWEKLAAKRPDINQTNMDVLFNMLEYFGRLFRQRAFEQGYVLENSRKEALENYFKTTAPGIAEEIILKKAEIRKKQTEAAERYGNLVKTKGSVEEIKRAKTDLEKVNAEKIDIRFLRFYAEELVESSSSLSLKATIPELDVTYGSNWENVVLEKLQEAKGAEKEKLTRAALVIILDEIREGIGDNWDKLNLNTKILDTKLTAIFSEPKVAVEKFEKLIDNGKLHDELNKSYTSLGSIIEVDPNAIESSIYRHYATALIASGKPNEAKAAIGRAIELNPLNPEHWDRLYKIAENLGQKEGQTYAIIGEELKKGKFDVYKWQKYKGGEIKLLFERWKGNLGDTFKKQRGKFEKEFRTIADLLVSSYNNASANGDYSLLQCTSLLYKLKLIREFVEEVVYPIEEMVGLNRNINQSYNEEAALKVLPNLNDAKEQGWFIKFKEFYDSYLENKRNLEELLQDLDFSYSEISKHGISRATELIKESGNNKSSIKTVEVWLDEGYIVGAVLAADIYLRSAPQAKPQIDEKITAAKERLYGELEKIRIGLNTVIEDFYKLPAMSEYQKSKPVCEVLGADKTQIRLIQGGANASV